MSGPRDKERRLDLVGAEDRPSRPDTELVRAAAALPELEPADHEALLALTLGEEVSELGEAERREAERLRLALEGRTHHPLAELCQALRAAAWSAAPSSGLRRACAPALAEEDHDALLALSIGSDPPSGRDEAEALARALAGRGPHPLAELAGALSAAHRAEALHPADGEALLGLALGETAPSDGADREEAARLARALEGQGGHPLAELAGALAAAQAAAPLDDLALERALRRALPRRGGRSSASFIVGTLVALAAGVALFVGSWGWLETSPVGGRDVPMAQAGLVASLAPSRSTQDLFDPSAPFPAKGGESERMEKIVDARAADLRRNRFAAWGIE